MSFFLAPNPPLPLSPPHNRPPSVKYALNTETNEAVAIKVMDKEKIQQQNMGQQIKKEISIMKLVSHPNIVKLQEVLASRTKIFIVLELVTGGELFDQIVKEGRFTEDKARKYFRQLCNGISYCNSRGVCHRDLKPENLLLDNRGDLKISDFGLSALYTGGDETNGEASRTTMLHTTCGTPNYVAPEVLLDQGYNGKVADIWSCGVILYVLLAGFLPFDEQTMQALFAKIQNADFQYPAWFSPDVKDMIGKILVKDPSKRVSLQDLMLHPWYTKSGTIPPDPVWVEPADGGSAAGDTSIGDTSLDDTSLDAGNGKTGGAAKTPTPREPMTPRTLAAYMSNNEAQSSMTRTASEARVKRVFQFKTKGDAPAIISALSESLTEMKCEIKIFDDGMKIKSCRMTPKGMIGAVLQLYPLEKGMHMVEVRRGKGDIMEYSNFYTELVKHKIAHLIEEIVEEALLPGEKAEE